MHLHNLKSFFLQEETLKAKLAIMPEMFVIYFIIKIYLF